MQNDPRFAFAGDRDIAVEVLRYLIDAGHRPLALFLRAKKKASHAEELRALCDHLDDDHVVYGTRFRRDEGLQLMRQLDLDYVVGIHFPYIVPPEVLELPREGVLNLHPAYLPFNRGWHTPSWALLEQTPIGATLHFMDAGVDSGDILAQKRVEPTPADTANRLYQRVKRAEFELFRESWPRLIAGELPRQPQDPNAGTTHKKEELLSDEQRKIDLDATTTADALLRKLRAHTTSDPDEACFFEQDGKRYRVRVEVDELS